jgi:ATP-binding cassette subfamily B (MDR/TAP) protein 1
MSIVSYQFSMGSLMYAMVCTRPNIAYIVGVVRWFMTNLGVAHWKALTWILRFSKVHLDHA